MHNDERVNDESTSQFAIAMDVRAGKSHQDRKVKPGTRTQELNTVLMLFPVIVMFPGKIYHRQMMEIIIF